MLIEQNAAYPRPERSRLLLPLILVILVCSACQEDRGRPQPATGSDVPPSAIPPDGGTPTPASPDVANFGGETERSTGHVQQIGARRVLSVLLDTLWYRGGVVDDTLLLFPLSVQADDSLVYVFDHGAMRLVALEAETGEPRWTYGRQGRGPGEFGDGAALALGGVDGGLRLWDRANSRFADIASDGQLLREWPLHPYTPVSDLCTLADGTTLLAAIAHSPPGVLHLGASGTPQRIPLPWPDLDTISSLAQQARMAPVGNGHECIFAFTMGRGFARIGLTGAAYVARYVEHFELAQTVTEPFGQGTRTGFMPGAVPAISTPSVDHDTLLMLFRGPRGEYRERFIDHYDARSGDYLYSLLLDAAQGTVVRANGVYFVLDNENHDFPSLMALRPR